MKATEFILQDIFKQLCIVLMATMLVQLVAMPEIQEVEYRELANDTMKLDRSSPAFIALEHLDLIAEFTEITDDSIVEAEAKTSKDEQTNEPTDEQTSDQAIDQIVQLPEETISRKDRPIIAQVLTLETDEMDFRVFAGEHSISEKKSSTVKDHLASQRSEESVLEVELREEQLTSADEVINVADSDWINSLNSQLRKRLLAADSKFGVLDKQWLAPSTRGLIKEVIASHVPDHPDIKSIPTQSGAPIIVMKPPQPEVSENLPTGSSRQMNQTAKTSAEQTTEVHSPIDGIKIATASGYSTPGYPVAAKKVALKHSFSEKWVESQSGRFSFPNVDGLSSTVLEIAKDSHWPTLKVAMASEHGQVKVFSDKMMNALLSAAVEDFDPNGDEARSYSIIYGEVESANLAGKTVKLLNQPTAKPIYFNEVFLPDPSLTATSSNGLFALVGQGSGAFILDVEDANVGIAPQLVITRPGYVSFVKAVESGLYSARFNFDTFGADQRVAIHNIALLEREERTSFTSAQIDVPERSNFNFVDVELEQGQMVRVMLNGYQALTQVPLLNNEVLERIDKHGIVQPNRGMLALYYEGEDFKLAARENGNDYAVNPLILNMAGEVVDDFESPCYLVFPNLEPGVFEYSIFQPSNENLTLGVAIIEDAIITSQSIYSEDE